jgi:hypothetical protein
MTDHVRRIRVSEGFGGRRMRYRQRYSANDFDSPPAAAGDSCCLLLARSKWWPGEEIPDLLAERGTGVRGEGRAAARGVRPARGIVQAQWAQGATAFNRHRRTNATRSAGAWLRPFSPEYHSSWCENSLRPEVRLRPSLKNARAYGTVSRSVTRAERAPQGEASQETGTSRARTQCPFRNPA